MIGAMRAGGVGGGKVEENGHACLYIAAPAKGVCGDAKKTTPLADFSLTYPPVCIAAPAKKRAGELKTPPAIPTALVSLPARAPRAGRGVMGHGYAEASARGFRFRRCNSNPGRCGIPAGGYP